jgi:hypothetical protein
MKRRPILLASALAFSTLASAALAQDVAREDTVIFDLDRTIQRPGELQLVHRRHQAMHGAHQAMWEPLFILNYTTGQLDPWLATGMRANDDFTEWTITLRDGVAPGPTARRSTPMTLCSPSIWCWATRNCRNVRRRRSARRSPASKRSTT